jgi:hypothetical protein
MCLVRLAVIGSSCASCLKLTSGRIDEDKSSTTNAIAEVHVRFNARQFDDLYDSTSPAYQVSRTREEAIAAMTQTWERFGSFQTVIQSELNVVVGAPIQIRAVYNSLFEKGPAIEQFVFLKESSSPRLAFYQIFPGAAPSSSQ